MQRIFAYVFKFLFPKLRSQPEALTPDDVKNGSKAKLLPTKQIILHFWMILD